MKNIGILASGRGSNLQAIIDAIEAGRLNAEIKIIISDNPFAFAVERARRHNIPFRTIAKKEFPLREDFDRAVAGHLKEQGVELVVLAGYMRLLSGVMIKEFPMRIINIHPSLLPSFTGLDVQKKALDWGVKFSGCTVHFVDEGLDSGPIIIQAVVPVSDSDTKETLSERILREEHRIYPMAIKLLLEEKISVRGRRVFIKDAEEPQSAVENPVVTI
ncbi:MAG: phosphoribosylglycinamide formyltransferase [Deltaproteobacteria bacterium]